MAVITIHVAARAMLARPMFVAAATTLTAHPTKHAATTTAMYVAAVTQIAAAM